MMLFINIFRSIPKNLANVKTASQRCVAPFSSYSRKIVNFRNLLLCDICIFPMSPWTIADWKKKQIYVSLTFRFKSIFQIDRELYIIKKKKEEIQLGEEKLEKRCNVYSYCRLQAVLTELSICSHQNCIRFLNLDREIYRAHLPCRYESTWTALRGFSARNMHKCKWFPRHVNRI